jgi:hypothetical protein
MAQNVKDSLSIRVHGNLGFAGHPTWPLGLRVRGLQKSTYRTQCSPNTDCEASCGWCTCSVLGNLMSGCRALSLRPGQMEHPGPCHPTHHELQPVLHGKVVDGALHRPVVAGTILAEAPVLASGPLLDLCHIPASSQGLPLLLPYWCHVSVHLWPHPRSIPGHQQLSVCSKTLA